MLSFLHSQKDRSFTLFCRVVWDLAHCHSTLALLWNEIKMWAYNSKYYILKRSYRTQR
jgi:hypothetical protein